LEVVVPTHYFDDVIDIFGCWMCETINGWLPPKDSILPVGIRAAIQVYFSVSVPARRTNGSYDRAMIADCLLQRFVVWDAKSVVID
jgi:hypothetical protein